MRNLRKRRGFGFDGGGGGGGGRGGADSEVEGALVLDAEGALGKMGLLPGSALVGIDVGGAVCVFPPGGSGGIRGTI